MARYALASIKTKWNQSGRYGRRSSSLRGSPRRSTSGGAAPSQKAWPCIPASMVAASAAAMATKKPTICAAGLPVRLSGPEKAPSQAMVPSTACRYALTPTTAPSQPLATI